MNRIIFIIGVSGSGKTTIGKLLSEKINLPFFDADDFHSIGNKQKMSDGIPLTDEDRVEWLKKINEVAQEQMKKKGAIIACSALKEKYRMALSNGVTPIWIFLKGSYDLIYSRLQERKGHYMPASLLSSQFETLESPNNSIVVNISKQPGEIVKEVVDQLPCN